MNIKLQSLENSVIIAAMKVAENVPREFLKGNTGDLAKLCRAVDRLKKFKEAEKGGGKK